MEVDFSQEDLGKILHHIKKWALMDKHQDLFAHKHIQQDQIKSWLMVKEAEQELTMPQAQSHLKTKNLLPK
jgi:uncharacterized protein YecE (DUF72 family)